MRGWRGPRTFASFGERVSVSFFTQTPPGPKAWLTGGEMVLRNPNSAKDELRAKLPEAQIARRGRATGSPSSHEEKLSTRHCQPYMSSTRCRRSKGWHSGPSAMNPSAPPW
eukprot:6468491-Amphidinium_carterae.2